MDKIKGVVLRKPNEIIEVLNRPLSSMGYKAYNFILSKFQEKKSNQIIISTSEILRAIGATDSYEELYQYLDELQKTQVKSIDKRGKLWGGFVLLSAFKKIDKGIYLEIPSLIANRLFKDENLYYTTIKLLEEKSFKSSYSLIFYEIFKRYENVSIPEYTIEDLRNMTKTETKYKIYYEFKRNVLNPALKEINSFNQKYIYEFQEEYLGRKVYKIKFKKIEKTKETEESTKQGKLLPALPEKLLKAIEKAKKNRFIQEKYSQRAVDKALEQFGEELLIKGLNELYKYNKSISSFSKILNAKIDDIKRAEEVKKQGTNIHNVTEELVKNEITGSEKLQDKEKSLNELIEIASAKLMTKNLSADKKINLCKELLKVKTEEELKEFCDKHDILLNLELF